MYNGPATVVRSAGKFVPIVDLVSHHGSCQSDLGLKWSRTVLLLLIKAKGIVIYAGRVSLVAHQTLGDGVASLPQLEPARPTRHRRFQPSLPILRLFHLADVAADADCDGPRDEDECQGHAEQHPGQIGLTILVSLAIFVRRFGSCNRV